MAKDDIESRMQIIEEENKLTELLIERLDKRCNALMDVMNEIKEDASVIQDTLDPLRVKFIGENKEWIDKVMSEEEGQDEK
jgi:hypothetical protein